MGDLNRIAMVLEYDGRGLCGWQRQDNGSTVQAHLEQAVAKMEDVPHVASVAAGRTDAGVHAEAMLVHLDVNAARFSRSASAYVHGVNHYLPQNIRVVAVQPVATDFHARFDCRERAYRYQIWNRTTVSSLDRWRHWWMPRKLHLTPMQEACTFLIGTHDFTSFRASRCQSDSPVREIRQLSITSDGWSVLIHLRANAFLHHMVRNIVGTLVNIGVGKMEPESISQLLQAKNRQLAGITAPAHGLYFTDAVYDDFSSADFIQPTCRNIEFENLNPAR